MQTYEVQEKLKSLSERLKYLARDKNTYLEYVDQKIKSENLQHNLSLIISHIILKLHFIERSRKVFDDIIEEYNNLKNTTLTFDDFEKIGWVRVIADEVIMPELVSHFIWQVGYYEKEEKPIEIPSDKNDIVRCLQVYSQRCFENAKLTISQAELETISKKYASKEITINFLVERKIIKYNSKSSPYYCANNEYSRHLKNEIASTLWLLIGGEKATIDEFKKYFKLIQGTEIWIDNLELYLSSANISKMSKLASEFLNKEKDLLKSDLEFVKIWLDAESISHIDIKTEIPAVDFNYENAYDFIDSVKHIRYHRELLDCQRTRSFCYSLLRIIIHNKSHNSQSYQDALRILTDISRPSLLWLLYQEIPKHFPYVIPYLLTDIELIPIAFKLIEKVGINDVFLSGQTNFDKKEEEICELRNHLWLEMFEFTLEQFSSTYSKDKEKGEVLAKVLIDLTEKVFTNNNNNRYNVINHNALRKRYNEALNKLSNQRNNKIYIYSSISINPRIIISLFPYIANYLKNKLSSNQLSCNNFLKLKSVLTDLSIEILRLSNLRFSEHEISDEQKQNIEKATKDLVFSLENYLSGFYTQIDIDFQSHITTGIENKKVQRGINEFGFEIIDWGYLFLHFQKYNALENLHKNFTVSLDFNTNENKYNDQNKEQFEKIKLYLKSLMLAFISINQKKDLYEIEGLPVKNTQTLLEKWIKELSLLYSIDDLPQKRIDAFNEMFSAFGYDIPTLTH